MIYLDSAATSLHKPREVADAVYEAILHMGNSGRGCHDISLSSSRIIYGARKKLAAFFGLSEPSQVVFTANSTQSLNIAIQGIFKKGDHVITTAMEHNSVLRPLYKKEREGVELTIIDCDFKGNLRYDLLKGALRPNTRAIVCTHASNLTGNLTDIACIGSLCREKGLLFVVDASQTAGIFPIHMEEMGIDVLCFTGHKSLLGPQGTGGMCIRKGVDIPSFYVGGSGVQTFSKSQPRQMPAHLEAGTLNVHGIAGLSAALDWIEKVGMTAIRKREQELMLQFYQAVKVVPHVTLYGDFSLKERAPIVALNIGENPSEDVCDELAVRYGIATRGGAHCAPLMHEQLKTAGQGAVRFSFCYFTKEEEVDKAVWAVKEIAKEWT